MRALPRNSDVEPERVPDDLWAKADRIKGYLTREEANLLWRYCKAPWCEIGTFCGRSAAVLSGRGSGWCVDLFEDWYAGESCTNLGAITKIRALRGNFRDVAHLVPDGLEFLYLDADHSYEATLAAFWAYEPKVKVGGHIALHDALELHPGQMDWPGTNSAMATLVREAYYFVAAAHRVVVFQKQ